MKTKTKDATHKVDKTKRVRLQKDTRYKKCLKWRTVLKLCLEIMSSVCVCVHRLIRPYVFITVIEFKQLMLISGKDNEVFIKYCF